MKEFIDSFEKIFGNKQRIMAVMAHPDDAEIYAGGTIARLVAEGKEVCVVKLTRGNKGSRQEKISEQELIALRTAEDLKGMAALGIKPENSIFLDLRDGEVENSLETIEKIVRQIRLFRPELIITHNPEDSIIRFDEENSWGNHRDHRHTGQSALDAGYPYSRDLLFFPEHFDDPKAQSVAILEYLLVDYYHHPETVYIDITEHEQTRTNAIAAHDSQYDQQAAHESTAFFTHLHPTKRYERFRYVRTD
jgi:LmbE family N-acetylglucosaminyl deacetylase